MAYTVQTWANDAGGNTPITAAKLTHIETGIQTADVEQATPKGAWAASTAYLLNDVVTHGGRAWRAAAAVPSRATFTETDWEAWAPEAPPVEVLNVGDPTADIPDGTLVFQYVDDTSGTYVFPTGPTGPTGPAGPAGADGTGGGGGSVTVTGALAGMVNLSSFSGASDDAKLTAALSYAAAQTHVPVIYLDQGSAGIGEFTFTLSRQTFSGLKISGVPVNGWQNAEQSGGTGKLVGTKVNLRCGTETSSWLVGVAQTFGVTLANISFNGTKNEQLYHHPLAAGTTYCFAARNIQLNGLKYGFGSPTNSLAITAASFDGIWNITNPGGTQLTLGGSDCELWTGGACNFGAGGSENAAGQYLMDINSLAKTTVGPLYFTADAGWRCLRIRNDTYTHHLKFYGARFEGRNASDPSYGALVRIEGGQVSFDNCWFAYAMSNPTAYAGTADTAYIEIFGGTSTSVRLRDCTQDRVAGQSETAARLISLHGGELDITGTHRAIKGGGTWTGRPRVVNLGGTVANSDYSVTVS